MFLKKCSKENCFTVGWVNFLLFLLCLCLYATFVIVLICSLTRLLFGELEKKKIDYDKSFIELACSVRIGRYFSLLFWMFMKQQ